MVNHIACITLLIALLVALLAKPLEAPLQHTGNVLLLTAHPDDECMFFAPTIRALVRAQTPVFSLCLSVGNADGLGSIRRDELAHSLEVLNIPAHRRWAVDHPDLQDNFTARWDPVTIASVLQPYVKSNNIETILTFDADGISGHPNHCSLPDGVAHLPAPPRLYTLVTRPLHAKYIGVLAPLLAKFSFYQDCIYPAVSEHFNQLFRFAAETSSPQPVIVSGIYDYLTALQAMRAHTSQLVWFRWLYVLFSRYMWINEWAESRPTPLR
ncbi:N-acetylglucosaminyl-phosphatidylinositol de-N-acetylase [Termitomyces sp. T112]|nr:hypothetical protein C0989_001543 [Termitomyces sp. Mn162]KAG5721375.1 N-acetylglucosaminyl-phosphatidylinositol de-N-acetylase [Termitomyces sp. T112]